MKSIERNPDIMVGQDTLPEGMAIIEGKHLMGVPRCLGLPFGVAKHMIIQPCGKSRVATLGIVIREEHVTAVMDAIAFRANKKKYCQKNK